MKRRKAMHYLRQMIDNIAIAYMISCLEKDVDLRRNAVRIYRKYWRYMKLDSIILLELEPDDRYPVEEGCVNIYWFDGLTTKKPSLRIVRNAYPSACSTLADKATNHGYNRIEFNRYPYYTNVKGMLDVWMEALNSSNASFKMT